MKKILTTSIEDGTIEKLRELAGGQRKVGEFLSDLVELLWQNRAIIESTELKDLVIAAPHRPDMEAEIRRLDAENEDMAKSLVEVHRQLSYFRAVIENAVIQSKDDSDPA